MCIVDSPCVFQPDRGAKRLREEDGGAGGEEDNSRGGKHIKGLAAKELARYREAEGGAEMRETEELTGDRKMILDKLMDEVEEEPEVGKLSTVFTIFIQNLYLKMLLPKITSGAKHGLLQKCLSQNLFTVFSGI